MVASIADDDPERDQSMSMNHTLSQCPDFLAERTALEEIAWRRGHIVVFTPEGHCELPGIGIEYNWGKMTQYYRRHNTVNGANFYELVLTAMSRDVLPLSTQRKYARKARSSKRAYREGESNEHANVEQMMKTFKTHRNALDFAGAFIRDS